MLDSDPAASELIELVKNGQINSSSDQTQQFGLLLDRLAPEDELHNLAVELYNGHLLESDPVAQRMNLVASALAYFETRRPKDRLGRLLGPAMIRDVPPSSKAPSLTKSR